MSVFSTAMTALDEATAAHALAELDRIKAEKGMDDLAEAQAIIAAIRELEKLRKPGGVPNYDYEWVPPLYALWYHNSHTQMAYHLAKSIPNALSPFAVNGPESIHLADFACGTMAMQFAAAIASAERLEADQTLLKIYVQSTDVSSAMWQYGKGLWKEFYEQLQLVELDEAVGHILDACQVDRFHFVSSFSSNSTEVQWLTALHAAYGEEEAEVSSHLERRVDWYQPKVIAVTAHQRRVELGQAFVPRSPQYDDFSHVFFGARWSLGPFASKADRARKQIYQDRVWAIPEISEAEKAFAKYNLDNNSINIQRSMPQRTSRMLYVRKDA